MKGFFNTGNTCYFNTALQTMMQVNELNNLFKLQDYSGKCKFTSAYQDVVRRYNSGDENDSIDVSNLLGCLKTQFFQFSDGRQHDVQEVILCILDIFEKSIPNIKKLFYGILGQETVWPEGKSLKDNLFCFSILDPGLSLEESLKKTHDWKPLEGYKDDNDKVWNIGATRTFYKKVPPYFLFTFIIRNSIEIPENIIINKSKFIFASGSIHTGGQNYGHYVSVINNNGKYKLIDDDTIQDINFPKQAGYYTIMYKCLNPETL